MGALPLPLGAIPITSAELGVLVAGGSIDRPCDWFAMCDNTAAGVVPHRVLGDVLTCQQCADTLRLDLHPFTEMVDVGSPARDDLILPAGHSENDSKILAAC